MVHTSAFALFVVLALAIFDLQVREARADHRDAGYLYLSPAPGAQFTSRQTRFILVRFKEVSPSSVTNLASFITVTGAISGTNSGKAKIAADARTVVYELERGFQSLERVTVGLDPKTAPGTTGRVTPFKYSFVTSGLMPSPPSVTARGQTPTEPATNAVDGDSGTSWADPFIPDGAGKTNWIQLLYAGNETRVVNAYSVTAASDLASAPVDWKFYGIDRSTNLVLLDSQTGRRFPFPARTVACGMTNVLAFRGYRLVISRIYDPARAASTQIAELRLIEPRGGLLREYWTGIPGKWVSDLTNNPRFPDFPDGREQLANFEVPDDWGDNYGTRIRGLITAPASGDFVFWISGDETAELWLGTSEDPATRRLIASTPDWSYPLQWLKYFAQTSSPIPLVAGQKYYVEALHKEGVGPDSLAVGWAKPGEGAVLPSEIIPGSVLSPIIGVAMSPGAAARELSGATDTPKIAAAKDGHSPSVEQMPTKSAAAILPNGVSIPSDFPSVEIVVKSNPAPGYIFLENDGYSGARYTMILNSDGAPVWYRRGEGRDFKVQRNDTISWGAAYTGVCTPFTGFDTNFVWQRTYSAVNGFGTDEHELKVLPDGGYLLLGARGEMADLRSLMQGGYPAAYVWQTVIQEFTADDELIFQFCGWDHFDIHDVDPAVENPRGISVRFPHMNAIDVDTDGHLLLSSRHLNEITKINRDTGEIIWRLGGAHSDFTFVRDSLNGFKAQHDISALGHDRYLLFDNGNGHTPPVSRAVEYELNLQKGTATLTWEFRDTPPKYAHFMGNAQRLPNGNTLINFALGEYPKVTEVDRAGQKRFVMNLSPHTDLYRAFRLPWNGRVTAPYLVIEPQIDGVTLIFNKFGDPEVDHYRIYSGTSPGPTNLLAVSQATLKRLNRVVNHSRNYFRVTAVSTNGVESEFSNEESLVVDIVMPGENMLLNPDFSQGADAWTLSVGSAAAATWRVEEGVACLVVANPGTAPSDVQLLQSGLTLIRGERYMVEFDAWADLPRIFEVRLGNYSNWQPFIITPVRTHYRFSFTMSAASDLDAALLFNIGANSARVCLDNVSVAREAYTLADLNRDGVVDLRDLQRFTVEWLKKGDFPADLNVDAIVDFIDFGSLGENWKSSGLRSAPWAATPEEPATRKDSRP